MHHGSRRYYPLASMESMDDSLLRLESEHRMVVELSPGRLISAFMVLHLMYLYATLGMVGYLIYWFAQFNS